MTDKKQIEEMANDIAKICPDLVESGCGQINCVTHLTLSLYKEGYRKQVEGEWIDKPTGAFSRMQSWCSACGKHSGIGGIESIRHKPFCPNCGAKMKGADNDRAD